MKKNNYLLFFALIFGIMAFSVQPALAKKKKKKKNLKLSAVQVLDDGTVCGYVTTKKGSGWIAVKQKGSKYKKDKNKTTNAACGEQLADEQVVNAFNKIPNIGDIISETQSAAVIAAAEGVPPTLGEIAETGATSSIKDIFFPEGVVEAINAGEATEEQCHQFFEGMAACHMAEGTGHTMQQVLSSGSNMCYMKYAPKAEGGVELVEGSGSVEEVFSSGVSEKVVKIQVKLPEEIPDGEQTPPPDDGVPTGEGPEGNRPPPLNMVIKVFSVADNQESGDRYHAQLIFCPAEESGESSPKGYEDIRVTSDLQLILTSGHQEGDGRSFNGSVSAGLMEGEDGDFVFDPAQSRLAGAAFAATDFSFKAAIEIDPGGELEMKLKDQMGLSSSNRYVVSEIQEGESVADLRFLRGAVKDEFLRNGSAVHGATVGTEYQVDRYLASDDAELLAKVAIKFSDDEFWSEAAAPSFEPPFDCSVEATHVLEVDLADEALHAVHEKCKRNFVEGMNFCMTDSEVDQRNVFEACSAYLRPPEDGGDQPPPG